jgi:hypothetical protein
MCYLNLNEEEMGKKSPDLGIGVQEMRHLTKGSVNGDLRLGDNESKFTYIICACNIE